MLVSGSVSKLKPNLHSMMGRRRVIVADVPKRYLIPSIGGDSPTGSIGIAKVDRNPFGWYLVVVLFTTESSVFYGQIVVWW